MTGTARYWLIVAAFAALALAGWASSPWFGLTNAQAHWQPGQHNVRHAINQAWCGRANRYCWQSSEAWSVARCETGGTFSVWARNGQYLGLFQMGTYARQISGHGDSAYEQARAAYRFFVVSGRDWSPWSCRWAAS